MWIKTPPKNIKYAHSNDRYLNFLWKDDDYPIYIMDNHLAALWCWLENIGVDDKYTLFHIDQHWDLATMNSDDISQISKLPSASLDTYLSLSFIAASKNNLAPEDNSQLIHWANYMAPIIKLRPNIKSAFLTATEDSDYCQVFLDKNDTFGAMSVESFFRDFKENLEIAAENKTIINIDLDFFYLKIGNEVFRAFSKEFLIGIVSKIKPYLNENTILTVAWSPECCGGLGNSPKGWVNSAQICKELCENLGIKCPSYELGLQNYSKNS